MIIILNMQINNFLFFSVSKSKNEIWWGKGPTKNKQNTHSQIFRVNLLTRLLSLESQSGRVAHGSSKLYLCLSVCMCLITAWCLYSLCSFNMSMLALCVKSTLAALASLHQRSRYVIACHSVCQVDKCSRYPSFIKIQSIIIEI